MGRRTESLTKVAQALTARAEAREFNKRATKRDVARARAARRDSQLAEEVREVFQGLAKQVQNEAHKKIAEIVTMCFESVFDDPYRFVITFEEKRGKTEAVLTFERRGVAAPPLEAAGGGACDVAAFALRVASLVLARPAARPVLVLDEPFRFVSKDRRPRIRQLLTDISNKLGVQIITVTHDPDLISGTYVELR